MAKVRLPVQPDPDLDANKRILAERQRRIDEAAAAAPPKQEHKESTATSAVEFLADEFDRKNFGDPIPTIERIVYGPDTLLDDPQFKRRIEQFGVVEIAECSRRAILEKGAMSQSSPMLQKGIARTIQKFGLEQTAQAFYDRVMRIPVRTVQVEVERDDEIFGDPLHEAVQKYGSPGMSPKFMSEACISQLSMRGYQTVRDERGDPVKVGTLIMTEIPQRIADARRKQYADESIEQVKESEEAYQQSVERAVASEGAKGVGSGPLYKGEVFKVNATETEAALGQERTTGINFDQQG